jgi:hypothetical protein
MAGPLPRRRPDWLARQARHRRGRRRLPDEFQLLIEGPSLRRPAPTIIAIHGYVAEGACTQDWPVPATPGRYGMILTSGGVGHGFLGGRVWRMAV